MKIIGILFFVGFMAMLIVFGPESYRYLRGNRAFRAWLRGLIRKLPDRWEVAIALLVWLVGWVTVKLINHSY